MAQSAEEYNSALAVWQSWTRLEPPGAEEDPRMLSPILEKISPTLPPEPKESATLPTTRPSRKKPGSVYVNKDLAAYKSMMESKQKEFDRLKTRLDGKEREVRRLKQQIESLEAIHLKFQERQKETSTP
jgi:predicted RNase H-like nuclease (RuvC/YqgF family)